MSSQTEDSPELPKRNKKFKPLSVSVNPTSEMMKKKRMEMDFSVVPTTKERINSQRMVKRDQKGKNNNDNNNVTNIMISRCNSSGKKTPSNRGNDMTPNSSNTNLRPSNRSHKFGKVSFEATSGIENCNSASSREISLKAQVENELRGGSKIRN